MEVKGKRSIQSYLRSLHRDIGFFVIGLAIIYGLSGIILIYRDTDFLKSDQKIEKQLKPNMEESKIGPALRIKKFEVIKTEGSIVYFQNGTYDKSTGMAKYTEKVLPAFIESMNGLHKTPSGKPTHWFSIFFGVCLLFLAISSFWMFKPKTKMFKRSLGFACAGLVFTIIILII